MESPDIRAPLASIEGYLCRFRINMVTGSRPRGSTRNNSEDAASIRFEIPLRILICAAVKDLHPVHGIQSGDFIPAA